MSRAAALLAAAALAGCDPDLGEPGTWIPIADMSDPLAAESGAATGPLAIAGAPAERLRVVTYNVHGATDVDALATALGEHPDLVAADLLLLQEIERHPAEGRSRAARLGEALGLGWVYVPARAAGDGTHGLAILSAFPIEEAEVMRLPESEVSQPRIAVRAAIRVGARRLHVIDTHLGAVLNISDRILQLRPAIIDGPDALLVAGDFNTSRFLWQHGAVPVLPADAVADTDQAPILDDYMRALGFDTPTAGLGATQHMLGVESRLDSIYTRGLVAIPGAVAREVGLSDHWPLWIDVDLR